MNIYEISFIQILTWVIIKSCAMKVNVRNHWNGVKFITITDNE
jgi:hypothetical protein